MACQFQRCFTRQVLLHFTCFFLSEASFIKARQVLLCLACLLSPARLEHIAASSSHSSKSSFEHCSNSFVNFVLSFNFSNYIILSIPFSTSTSSTSSSNQSSSSFVIFRSARTSCTTSEGWVRSYEIKIWTPIYRHTCLMNHQETHETNPVQSSTTQYSPVPPSTV